MALGASGATAANITHQRLKDGLELIVVVGDIKSGDELEFRRLAIQFDKAVVGFSSNGGALLPALEIGTALHLRGFDTAVIAGDQCASACALIWAAGVNRYLVKGARVGFHASYVEDGGKAIETGLGNALVGRYLTQLGLSEKAVVFATASHPDSIAWLTQESDALSSGISFNFSIPVEGGSTQSPVARAVAPKLNGPYTSIGRWSIYRNTESCTAVGRYKDNSFFSVRYYAKTHGTVIGFSYPDGTSLNEGDERAVAIYLVSADGTLDDGWKAAKFTVQVFEGIRILSSFRLDDPALSDLRSAKQIGFFYNDKIVSAFNLDGLRDAIGEVSKCSLRVNNINPKDVFAN